MQRRLRLPRARVERRQPQRRLFRWLCAISYRIIGDGFRGVATRFVEAGASLARRRDAGVHLYRLRVVGEGRVALARALCGDAEQRVGERRRLALLDGDAQMLKGFLRLVGLEQGAAIKQADAGEFRVEFEGARQRSLRFGGRVAVQQDLTERAVGAGEVRLQGDDLAQVGFGLFVAGQGDERRGALIVRLIERRGGVDGVTVIAHRRRMVAALLGVLPLFEGGGGGPLVLVVAIGLRPADRRKAHQQSYENDETGKAHGDDDLASIIAPAPSAHQQSGFG